MASSKVSCMLVSLLLLLLVLSDVDKALGEPIQLRNRKLKVTEHHDQVTTDLRLAAFSKSWVDDPKVTALLKKVKELVGNIPVPSPSPVCNVVCKRNLQKLQKLQNLKKAYYSWIASCRKVNAAVCKRNFKNVIKYYELFKA